CSRVSTRRHDTLRGSVTGRSTQILENVISRDQADMTRAISPLRRAEDALELDNSYMSVEEQMAWFMERYNKIVG
ncbi:MAG: (d)CMP kinase, partial [Alistipes sp.]|nr:(d)CMP kinase [Alistipes sp.]